jgi:WhiB family redox-sensing transcriptional regulator
MSRKGLPNLSHRPSRAAAETLWQEEALCQQVPVEFFPNKGDRETAETAKRVCKLCPVIAECLEYALTHDEWAGVWGGMSERQRRELKRARRDKVAHVPATGMVSR